MENPMDCIVHGVAESRTRLMEFHFFFQTLGHGAERGRSHVLCKVIFLCGRKDHESLHKIFLHFLIFLFVFLLFSSMSGMNASFMSKFSKTGHWNFKFSSRKWCQLWKYEKKNENMKQVFGPKGMQLIRLEKAPWGLNLYLQSRANDQLPLTAGLQWHALFTAWLFIVVVAVIVVWPCHTAYWILFPEQGWNTRPLHWKCRVLTTELPGKSLPCDF